AFDALGIYLVLLLIEDRVDQTRLLIDTLNVAFSLTSHSLCTTSDSGGLACALCSTGLNDLSLTDTGLTDLIQSLILSLEICHRLSGLKLLLLRFHALN